MIKHEAEHIKYKTRVKTSQINWKTAAFISLSSLLVTPTDIGANSRFSDNCKRLLRADKSKISLTVSISLFPVDFQKIFRPQKWQNHSVEVAWNNAFRKIFNAYCYESVKPLQYYCYCLPVSILLPMKKLLFWKKMSCSGNMVLCRLAKCCDASIFVLAAKFYLEPLL